MSDQRLKPLQGKLKKRAAAPPGERAKRASEPAASEPVAAPSEESAGKAKASRPAGPQARTRRRSRDGRGATRSLTFRTPVEIRDGLRERSFRDGIAQPDVILEAVRQTNDKLSDLLAKPKKSGDDLFTRSPARRKDRPPLVQISVRIPAEDHETLNRLTERHKADNRSDLLNAALKAYLEDSGS
jgi:hypothetical protein